MDSNRLAFVALGFACVAAAAGGGYLATRQNATETVASSQAIQNTETPVPNVQESQEVQETEALVGAARSAEPEPAQGSTPAPPAPPAPVKTAAAPRPRPAPTASTTARNTPLPTLTESWPSPSNQQPEQAPPAAAPPQEPPAPVARQEDTLPEPVKAPEPDPVPERIFEELVVAADSVIGLQMDTALTSERARVEDRVEARVTRDVRVNGQVAIPSGAHAIGTVTAVDRGGKFKDRARIGIRFTTLVLADGSTLPITTETIYRYGDAPASAAKIGGGAVGGAILGAILGGAKGAAIGAAAGAGGGAASVQAGERNAATFPNGTQLTARFLSPVTVTIEK